MHVCRSLQSMNELKRLASVPTQIVSPQASAPVMGLVQDSLLGMYRITNDDRPDYKSMNLMNIMHLAGWTNAYQGLLPYPTSMSKDKDKDKDSKDEDKDTKDNQDPTDLKWNGRDFITSYFPKITYARDVLTVKNGVIESGYFDKSSFGPKAGSVIHITWNDYGPETTRHLFDNTMNTACQWLLIDGFSVGLKDTYISSTDHADIRAKIRVKLIEAKLKIDFLHRGLYPILGDVLQKAFNDELRALVGHYVPEDQERFLDTGQSIDEQFETDIFSVLDGARTVAENETNKKVTETAKKEGRSNRMESMIKSGSKGSKVNMVQIISLLGQQTIEGKRAPEDFHRRTLPHFYKDNITPESHGFIENSYLSGLEPTEYFFHTMAGRIGVISTSIKTAETGYLQRRLMKVMEDAKIAYDGTVRNANDMILQYSYGSDCFDGSKLETTSFDYLNMTNSNFQRIYQYMPDEDIHTMLSPDAYNELTSTPDWESQLEAEFADIVNDRATLKTVFKNGMPDKIYSPVNFKRLLKNYQYRYDLAQAPGHQVSPLGHASTVPAASVSPVYVIGQVKDFINEIITEDRPPLGKEENYVILVATIRSYLASKKIIGEKYTKEAFDFLMQAIRKQYYQALITPGEMVGAIAAQSIGEPTTQLTLDTFHKLGTSSGANVARGVPRLKEILRIAHTLETPALEVHLDQNYLRGGNPPDAVTSADKEMAFHRAEAVAVELEYTVLKNIVSNVQIIYDESDCSTAIKEDQSFIDTYYAINPNCQPQTSNSPWLLRIQFNEEELHKKGITLLTVEAAIKANSDGFKELAAISCIFSDDNAEQLICRVKVAEGVLNSENPVNVMRLLERLILNIKIKGIDNITTARSRLVEPVNIPRLDGTIGKSFDYVIDTVGVNLIDVFNAPHVDWTKTISNHIYEIMEVLGVEAARQMVIDEITNVLKFNGAYVNPRHIELLADVMCREGYLISVDRHGTNKSDSGPWARASFEETTNQLFGAAMYGEEDPMTGVSANIMFGQPFIGGTNSFEVSLDEALLEGTEIPDLDLTPFKGMAEPGDEMDVTDNCDFTDDKFVFQL